MHFSLYFVPEDYDGPMGGFRAKAMRGGSGGLVEKFRVEDIMYRKKRLRRSSQQKKHCKL